MTNRDAGVGDTVGLLRMQCVQLPVLGHRIGLDRAAFDGHTRKCHNVAYH